MIKIGKMNQLRVLRSDHSAVYLDAEHLGEAELPIEQSDSETKDGDILNVFLYADSESRAIANIKKPFIMLDECGALKVVDVTPYGAFLNWGLEKDLFVPNTQQQTPMRLDQNVVVTVYLDEMTNRLAASSKLSNYLLEFSSDFKVSQEVDLIICGRSDLGYKAVINQTHLGVIYASDVFQPLKTGQHVKGYIKLVRPDLRIDLTLQQISRAARDDLQGQILEYLTENNGESELTDKSPPDDIYKAFSVSKGNYKKALGALYKQGKITLDKTRVALTDNDSVKR